MKTSLKHFMFFAGLLLSTTLFAQTDSTTLVADSILAVQEAVVETPVDTVASPMPLAGFSFHSLWRGLLGMVSLLGIAILFSRNRRSINWRIVIVGLSLQIVIALGILYIPFVHSFFDIAGKVFVKIMDFTRIGTEFLVGDLLDTSKVGYIFLFQVLPTLIFFSALTSLLYYLGVIQKVVFGIAWALRKLFGLSGAEGLTVAGNIFLGQTEAPLLAKRYLPAMSPSEMFLVMSAGMATIAGGTMAAYIGMLGGESPEARLQFAQYLLSASVMAAPAVIVFAKVIMPQTEEVTTDMNVSSEPMGNNPLEAISMGTVEGIRLAVNVGAMLLVIIAMMAFLDYILGGLIGSRTGLNTWLTSIMGRPTVFNFQFIVGLIFTPIAWLMGVCMEDINTVGGLLGTKIIINEFVAYSDLSVLKELGTFVQEKSVVMSTFILCGFANISSIGILLGGVGALAPNHRPFITKYGLLAMLCGTLASCMSATIMGMILG